MTTDKALDKMALIAPWFAEIFDDADAKELTKEIRSDKGQTPAGSVMQKLIPLFAGKYREALYNIVSIASDVPVEKIREQPIVNTLNMLRGALIDETMLFFLTCLRLVKNI